MGEVSCIVSPCDGVDCVGMDGDDVRSMLGVLHRRIAVSCWLKVASIIARGAIVGGNDPLLFSQSGTRLPFGESSVFLVSSVSLNPCHIGGLAPSPRESYDRGDSEWHND